MLNIDSIQAFLNYSDWANDQILRAAAVLPDAQLDQSFDMGRGSLRKTLVHVWAGEHVWVQRWQGRTETPWPDEEERVGVAALAERFEPVVRQRNAFLATVHDAALSRVVTYRDSKGSLFQAALGDMMMQMIVHSIHHRAQAVNMLRRVGAAAPELDYMMWVRKPA
jgi:uncharacterized damage-inducible protein DinB